MDYKMTVATTATMTMTKGSNMNDGGTIDVGSGGVRFMVNGNNKDHLIVPSSLHYNHHHNKKKLNHRMK
ncbi:hypothetical protein DERF_015880 [Dermatophagoides farinae]|uniref:Uncharacterized protein n=1 Tax=Dermatophagoides farinae TaxID=6954 RepID=A0A922HFJ0_DERFA|nr:hypothetical protein DERF_015880 [Dermatophagoides farinae]